MAPASSAAFKSTNSCPREGVFLEEPILRPMQPVRAAAIGNAQTAEINRFMLTWGAEPTEQPTARQPNKARLTLGQAAQKKAKPDWGLA
jgi:hypothetical protein